MLKKAISYVDFNGDQQSEVFYFNLTKAELVEMQLVKIDKNNQDGLQGMLLKIAEDKSGAGIISTMKDIIAKAYGVRSDDGKRFIKSPALSAEFESTAAYSELFLELVTDADKASAFINGIVPQEIALTETEIKAAQDGKSASEIARERSEAQLQGHKSKAVAEPQREVTGQKDLNDLSHEELLALAEKARLRGALEQGVDL